MVDVWLDAVTPKDSLLLSPLLLALRRKGYSYIVTAKEQTQTTDILKLLNVTYTGIGKYGETLKEKLMEEQKRTLAFIELFDKIGQPRVLWTHGDVSAIRTAFGLRIPIVYSNDTPHALHVAKLVSPLVDWLIAPKCFGKSWSKFGIPKNKIILYDGVEELAWLTKRPSRTPEVLKELANKEHIILFRNVEYQASYYKNVKVDTWQLVNELSKISTVVYIPRYHEEKEKLKELSNVWVPPKPTLTFQAILCADVVVGSGGTICRESALMGVPTINFHFWDAVAKYLCQKGFPIQYSANVNKILLTAKKIVKNPKRHRLNTVRMLARMENPTGVTTKYIEKCLKPS